MGRAAFQVLSQIWNASGVWLPCALLGRKWPKVKGPYIIFRWVACRRGYKPVSFVHAKEKSASVFHRWRTRKESNMADKYELKKCSYVFRGSFVHSTSQNAMEIMQDKLVGVSTSGKVSLFILYKYCHLFKRENCKLVYIVSVPVYRCQ